jgi:hypothetical protein
MQFNTQQNREVFVSSQTSRLVLGDHSASCSMGDIGSFLEVNAVGACSLQLTPLLVPSLRIRGAGTPLTRTPSLLEYGKLYVYLFVIIPG